MTDAEVTQIYVYLLDEGVDVWRPVTAERVGDELYRITSETPDPEFERWEFVSGEVVRCIPKLFASGERRLVAVARVTPESPRND